MKRSWKIFWHVFFWLCLTWGFGLSIYHETKISLENFVIQFSIFSCINISLFYLNFLIFIPKFLGSKKYKIYIATLIAVVIIWGIGKYNIALMLKCYTVVDSHGKYFTFRYFFINSTITCVFILFLSTALKFTSDWFLNERVKGELENQRLNAELAFLKSQINPHFLFNSLNSIYSLAYQKSDTAPDAILKLSEIMRYMLYESDDTKVALAEELQYLQNYIDLQRIRFADAAFVDFKITGKVAEQKIVPLLLIAFIENAFKHGVTNDPSSPILLRINLDETHLHLFVENKKHILNRDSGGGIGLNNVKRRLDLLYPNKYTLNIRDKADTYTSELSIIL